MFAGRKLIVATAPPHRGDIFRQTFMADLFAVRHVLRGAVARFARRLTAEDAGTLELVLAEVLNNIVEHGYRDLAPGRIEIDLRHSGTWLDCRIVDGGRPMPDLAPPDCPLPAADVAIDDLAEGGWGWTLIRELTDDLRYQRENGRNRLSFRVPLTPT